MKEKNQFALSVDKDRLLNKKLNFLCHFNHLTHLCLRGFSQNQVELIKDIKNLKELILLSCKINSYSFLKSMRELESLDIRFGGTKDFSELGKLKGMKSLALLKIINLKDVSFLAEMTNLQYIEINSCKKIIEFPSLLNLKNLRRIVLETMKGLRDISGVSKAPFLEDLIIMEAKNIDHMQLNFFLKHKALKRIFPGIVRLNSTKFKELSDLFSDRIIDSYYGTKIEQFNIY